MSRTSQRQGARKTTEDRKCCDGVRESLLRGPWKGEQETEKMFAKIMEMRGAKRHREI